MGPRFFARVQDLAAEQSELGDRCLRMARMDEPKELPLILASLHLKNKDPCRLSANV
jgi:hypothetical protein